MLQGGKNPVLNEIVQVVESATKAEQKRMLYLLKVEKTRSLARKLSKRKPKRKFTDEEITATEVGKKLKKGFKLTEAYNKELDARKRRHLKGTSRSYTWEEVKQRARQALKR